MTNHKTKLKTTNNPTIYAFIDAQNLNYGLTKDIFTSSGKLLYEGWDYDLKKLRVYLKDKYKVDKAILFLGYIEANKKMYQSFSSYGYEIVFKMTVKGHKDIIKGNCDAELVLQASAIDYPNYDQAVIITGDGDFGCLVEFLRKRKKLKNLLVPNPYSCSRILKGNKNILPYIDYLHILKKQIKLDKK